MQVVKWAIAKLQGDKNCDFLLDMGGREPKGPFRTKSAIAMEIVVFSYCGSIYFTIRTDSLKNSIQSGVALANQTQNKGRKRKVHEFHPFCEFWCFSTGKQARFTSKFGSNSPGGKLMNRPCFGLVCRNDS